MARSTARDWLHADPAPGAFRLDRETGPLTVVLAGDVVDRVPRLQRVGAHFKQFLRDKLADHKQYIMEYGDDMPEIKNWTWPY